MINFPIAILSGDSDVLSTPKDVAWTAKQLEKVLVYNHEYHLDHFGFSLAKDMRHFTVDTMAIFNYYNDKCDRETLNSRF